MFYKKVLFKISHHLQEIICARSSFFKKVAEIKLISRIPPDDCFFKLQILIAQLFSLWLLWRELPWSSQLLIKQCLPPLGELSTLCCSLQEVVDFFQDHLLAEDLHQGLLLVWLDAIFDIISNCSTYDGSFYRRHTWNYFFSLLVR